MHEFSNFLRFFATIFGNSSWQNNRMQFVAFYKGFHLFILPKGPWVCLEGVKINPQGITGWSQHWTGGRSHWTWRHLVETLVVFRRFLSKTLETLANDAAIAAAVIVIVIIAVAVVANMQPGGGRRAGHLWLIAAVTLLNCCSSLASE